MHLKMCTVLVMLVLMGGVGAQSLDCSCNTTKVWEALSALYHSTNGAAWTFSDNWLKEGSTVCEWYGYTGCTTLSLSYNNLAGTLPPELSLLEKNLVRLLLDGNELTGSLPSQYESLSDLAEVNVSANALSGPLPEAYHRLAAMEIFDVSDNLLNGSLPHLYSQWADVHIFIATGNALSGTLPREYGAWSYMSRFWVGSNHFTGTLPPEYGMWQRLIWFTISGTNISGTLPEEYANWTRIGDFRAAGTKISGTLPEVYVSWKENIGAFDMELCLLNGTLPISYSNWTRIYAFRVQANQLTGTLPTEYSKWPRTTYFLVGKNRFVGELPTSYSAWRLLHTVRFEGNAFVGTLPTEYSVWGSSVSTFQAHDNALHGQLPEAYAMWSNVSIFSVSSNHLTSSIPVAYANWTKLQALLLANNSLSGSLPAFMSSFEKLTVAVLCNNNFSGGVPPSWVSLPPMFLLLLCSNPHLTGTIPKGMPFVATVCLCNTTLCGAVPTSWSLTALLSTTFVCSSFTTRVLDAVLGGDLTDLTPLPKGLASCSGTSTPAAVATTSAQLSLISTERTSSLRSTAVAVSVGITAVGATVLGTPQLGGGLLQISLRSRFQGCAERAYVLTGVGQDVADNPSRIDVAGRMSFAGGTVVGNVVMLVSVPLLAWVFRMAKSACLRRHRCGKFPLRGLEPSALVMPFVAVFCSLCVPTAAASVLLIVDVAVNAIPTRGAAALQCVVAALGMTCVVVPVGIVVRLLWVTRSTALFAPIVSSHASHHKHKHHTCPSTRNAVTRISQLFVDRGRWDLSRIRAGWMAVVLKPPLRGIGSPRRWILVWDGAWMLVQGLWIGVGSTPGLSCAVTDAMRWALFGSCVLACGVAVVIHPRQTTFDVCVDVVMHFWTAVTVLLVCLGESDEVADGLTTAQAVLQVLFSMPVVAPACVKCWQGGNQLKPAGQRPISGRRNDNPHRGRREFPSAATDATTPENIGCLQVSQVEQLRFLIERIVATRQQQRKSAQRF